MLDPVMSSIDHRKPLGHGVNAFVVPNISGDQYLGLLPQRLRDHAFARSGEDRRPFHPLAGIPEYPHIRKPKDLLHLTAQLLQGHLLLQISDLSKPLVFRFIPGRLQGPCPLPAKPGSRQLRHPDHIIIGVHGIIGYVTADQV